MVKHDHGAIDPELNFSDCVNLILAVIIGGLVHYPFIADLSYGR